ncbi:MAG: 23S rRNA (uracil(1939)-C(5))-methyltransferase RlmD [Saprospiraceae bacterium]
MGRRRKPKIVESVRLTEIADKGKAFGKKDDMAYFVEGAVPGDLVDVLVTKSRTNFKKGRAINIREYSDKRVEPFCPHFDICGGCKWQNLSYEEQIVQKSKVAKNAIERLGRIEIPDFQPILGAEKTQYYRNKMEFSFSNKRWLTEEEVQSGEDFSNRNALGFHRPGAFDKIVQIDHCYLQGGLSNEIRNDVYAFANEHNFTFFDIRNKGGLLRNLMIRTSTLEETMVVVIFYDDDKEKRDLLLNHLQEKFPQITALQYIINQKANDTFLDLPIETHYGRDFIYEQLGHLKYKIGAKSFFQTNTEQALHLYNIVAEFAGLSGNENVYDLYTGTGSIALFLAHKAKHVVGIEEVAPAIDDAIINASNNEVENVTFYVGDVKDILTDEFAIKHGKPDVLITDPPRVGMHQKVVEMLLQLESPRIVYVSCNPATQARDLQLLSEKYQLLKVRPVDMFPHTHHIENVALLELK